MTIQDIAQQLNLRIKGSPLSTGSAITVTLVNAKQRERVFILPYPISDGAAATLKQALANW